MSNCSLLAARSERKNASHTIIDHGDSTMRQLTMPILNRASYLIQIGLVAASSVNKCGYQLDSSLVNDDDDDDIDVEPL